MSVRNINADMFLCLVWKGMSVRNINTDVFLCLFSMESDVCKEY